MYHILRVLGHSHETLQGIISHWKVESRDILNKSRSAAEMLPEVDLDISDESIPTPSFVLVIHLITEN